MIETLDDAWEWYKSTRTIIDAMGRIGRDFWDLPEWHDALARDKKLRTLESAEIADLTRRAHADLDDIAVLMMFSVFEATVRDDAIDEVKRASATVDHPALRRAVALFVKTLNTGHFADIMDAYKSREAGLSGEAEGWDTGLSGEVEQVRAFRNWVAHGRREPNKSAAIDPTSAFDRLKRYLEKVILQKPESANDDQPSGDGNAE